MLWVDPTISRLIPTRLYLQRPRIRKTARSGIVKRNVEPALVPASWAVCRPSPMSDRCVRLACSRWHTPSTTPRPCCCRRSSSRSSTSSASACRRWHSWPPPGPSRRGWSRLSYAELTRRVSRRRLLGLGGILFGGGFAAQALATGFPSFAVPNILSRIGGSPQHPVGNGLLAEQFPPSRRGFAISAHIAGGNLGTVVIAIIGAPMLVLIGWRGASIVFGVAAIVIALGTLTLIREHGTDRAAAVAGGAAGTRCARSSPTATCAGSSSPPSWAVAAAVWGS